MNLPKLAESLESLGLMQRAFVDLSREEAESLVRACWDTLEPTDARRLPYFRAERDGTRTLVTPFDSPECMKTWLKQDGFLALHDVLRALGATGEEMTAYMGPNWKEQLKARWNNPLNHEKACPMCGEAKKEKPHA